MAYAHAMHVCELRLSRSACPSSSFLYNMEVQLENSLTFAACSWNTQRSSALMVFVDCRLAGSSGEQSAVKNSGRIVKI